MPLLTVASVKAMKDDYLEDERLLAELPARVAEKKRRFEAALLFVSEEQRAAIFEENPKVSARGETDKPPELTSSGDASRRFVAARGGRPTWTGVIMRVIESADQGLPHDQLMAEIAKLDPAFGKELARNAKPYYNAMSKLEHRQAIEKRAGYFYRPGLLSELRSQEQELPEEPKSQLKEYSAAWFINGALESAGVPMSAHEIREALRHKEGVTPTLITNKSFIFNVLKALQGDGYIEKDEETKKYYSSKLRPRGNGAS